MASRRIGLKSGSPSKLSDEIADAICERMINGEDLVKICKDPTMPERSTVYTWMARNPDFHARITAAREGLADHVVSKIIEIADKTKNATVSEDSLKIGTYKWYASKIAPRQYGERPLEITGPNGGAIQVEHRVIDTSKMDDDMLDTLEQILLSAQNALLTDGR